MNRIKSSKKSVAYRNGKIHRYPLRVRKLLCFTKDTYKRIVRVIKGLKKKEPAPSSLKKPKLIKRQRIIKTGYRHNNVTDSYEPTDIWNARESTYWQWRRVREWYREFSNEYSKH